ncbi:MAG: hypothetical protein IKH32_03485 [Prevotella sp.]|nr:hypothetical protein [Prevotella sp.]
MKEEIINEMTSFLDTAPPEQMREDFEEMKSFCDGSLASDYLREANRLIQNSPEHNQPDCSFIMMSTASLTSDKHFVQV